MQRILTNNLVYLLSSIPNCLILNKRIYKTSKRNMLSSLPKDVMYLLLSFIDNIPNCLFFDKRIYKTSKIKMIQAWKLQGSKKIDEVNINLSEGTKLDIEFYKYDQPVYLLWFLMGRKRIRQLIESRYEN